MVEWGSGAVAVAAVRHHGLMKQDADALAAVAAVLWEEREQLEELLFALVGEQLVVRSGNTRWLVRADRLVQRAVERLRDSEVIRAAQVQTLAQSLGIPADTRLAGLAEQSPEPWGEVFAEHRTALRALVAEIDGAVAENRTLLQAGAQAIRDTLDRLTPFESTYNSRGGQVRRHSGPALLDEQA